MDDPSSIAAKLTKAQADALKLIAAAETFVACHSRSSKALFSLGMIHRALWSGDPFAVEVSDLGRAVAAVLRQSEGKP